MNRARRAMTLVELLVALVIVAICSIAVERMLAAALQSERYLNKTNAAMSEVELAVRRMTHALRTCQSVRVPAGTASETPIAAQSSFSLVTQPDPDDASKSYSVTYQLSGTTLQEIDSRYGTNTLVNNVSAFSVIRDSASPDSLIKITLTLNTQPAVTRTFRICCRNL